MLKLLRLCFLSFWIGFTLVAFSCEDDVDPPVLEQDGSASGGGVDCTKLTYNGPTNDYQIESQCRLAQVYKCQGNTNGVAICCKNIKDMGGTCPYC